MKFLGNCSFSQEKIIAGENSAPGVISLITGCENDKIREINLNDEKFGKLSLINKAFQYCYLNLKDFQAEGGINGGKIISEGTPEKVAENDKSYTGNFIKELLGSSKMKKTA